LPATHQSLAHLFPIYEMGSRKAAPEKATLKRGKRNAEAGAVLGAMFSSFD
jgi:hypothetical protein